MKALVFRVLCIFLVSGHLQVQAALEVQDIVTPQGVKVWLAPCSGPVVSLRVVFRGAGACCDPEGKAGRACVFADMCLEGAGDLDSAQLAGRLEDLSSRVSLEAGRDHMVLHVLALRRHLDATCRLVREILFRPRLQAASLEKVRRKHLADLAFLQGDPGWMLQKAALRSAVGYTNKKGPLHAYARFPTEQTLNALTLDDMKDVFRFRGLDTMDVTVAGNLTRPEVVRLVQDMFAGMAPHADKAFTEDVALPVEGSVLVLDKDIPQSMIAFFQPGVAARHPDYHAAVVLDGVLGGGAILSSRLAREVREKGGYAYSVGTSLLEDAHMVRWAGRAGSSGETALKAVQTIRKVWSQIAENGVTVQELEAIRDYLAGSWPLGFTTSEDITERLAWLRLQGRSVDDVNAYPAAIRKITPDHVRRVARESLDPRRLCFVIVGRPAPLQGITVQAMSPSVLD